LVQTGRFPFDPTNTDASIAVNCIVCLCVATNVASSHKLFQLITSFKSTRPDIAFLVEAHLISLRGVNAIEPIWRSIQDKGVAICNYCFFGPTRDSQDAQDNRCQYAHEICLQSAQLATPQYHPFKGEPGLPVISLFAAISAEGRKSAKRRSPLHPARHAPEGG
jgi:hypothetical protein